MQLLSLYIWKMLACLTLHVTTSLGRCQTTTSPPAEVCCRSSPRWAEEGPSDLLLEQRLLGIAEWLEQFAASCELCSAGAAAVSSPGGRSALQAHRSSEAPCGSGKDYLTQHGVLRWIALHWPAGREKRCGRVRDGRT